MFNKEKVSMLKVLDDQIDRVGDQRKVSLTKIVAWRFKLADDLLKLQPFLQANFFKCLLGVLVKSNSKVVEHMRSHIVLVHQFANPAVFQRQFVHESVNINNGTSFGDLNFVLGGIRPLRWIRSISTPHRG